MAANIYLNKIGKFEGKEVILKGWIFNKRESGSIAFLQFRDGTGFIQAVIIKSEVPKQVFDLVKEITLESSVILTGKVKKEPRAPSGYEITVINIKLIQKSEDFPIGKKEHGPDFLLSNRHLWLRSKSQWAILRIRHAVRKAISNFMQNENFVRIDTPIITPNASEGTTTLFEIDYFGQKAYLSQSGQLYLESAIFSFGRCYDFSPALRNEKSKTKRHLVEFWMMDAEAAFVDFEENMIIQENLIQFIIDFVLENCLEELKILERDINILKSVKLPYQRITYDESLKILKKLGSSIKWGTDFGNNDETLLMNYFKQPVFVTHFPAEVKAFYCKKDEKNEKLAKAADLLLPEGYGEVIGGSEREEDINKLVESIKLHKYKMEDYQWYLDLRRYGSVPHSGFGLGLERMVACICRLDHVRETIPFPRTIDRFKP